MDPFEELSGPIKSRVRMHAGLVHMCLGKRERESERDELGQLEYWARVEHGLKRCKVRFRNIELSSLKWSPIECDRFISPSSPAKKGERFCNINLDRFFCFSLFLQYILFY